MLQSPGPMLMLAGKTGLLLFNDAYANLIGAETFLGKTYEKIWPKQGAPFSNVIAKGLVGKSLVCKGVPQKNLF